MANEIFTNVIEGEVREKREEILAPLVLKLEYYKNIYRLLNQSDLDRRERCLAEDWDLVGPLVSRFRHKIDDLEFLLKQMRE